MNKKDFEMKYVVKYRPRKQYPFRNVMEGYTATRGRFKGYKMSRDRLFDTIEDAEEVRKRYAERYGEENTKIGERKA